ncbi:D-alanyl-D-alanine carboxypeptidase [Clostridiaceae bacterium]|nr:D-alanyl-D-alanine carboxypeptidase [Clostridiaceae bacterium]RKI14725.1 D-alanyl-D-alanine carboxypeptidase [bacterium 1XD21-70]
MKQKIRRLVCCCLAAIHIFTITVFAEPPVWPSDTGIQAESGAVIDADSGALLFGQNCVNTAYPPASITKLLTALIVLEHCELDEVVTFSETAMNHVEADSGNKYNLLAGERLTVEDCLHLLLLVSTNQAANALAEHVAGSIPAFVDMMNAKVAELGCSSKTHFDNPSGLNGDTQHVTAYDMALIAQAAFDNESLLKVSSALSYKINSTISYPDGFTIRQEHRLVSTTDPNNQLYYPPAIAGKTGYLMKAGNTLVTYAEKDGRRLISVVLKGSPNPVYFLDGKTLLEFGFDRFQNVSITDHETRYVTGEESIDIQGTSYLPSDLMIEPGRVITLPRDASFEDAALALEPLSGSNPPANAVAVLRYTYNDRFIGSAYLMTKESLSGVDVDLSISPGSNDSDPDESKRPGRSWFSRIHLPGTAAVAIAVLTLLGTLTASAVFWVLYSRRKEARELAARREARRRRLKAHGDEDEFERLLEMRKSREISPQKRRSSPPRKREPDPFDEFDDFPL